MTKFLVAGMVLTAGSVFGWLTVRFGLKGGDPELRGPIWSCYLFVSVMYAILTLAVWPE